MVKKTKNWKSEFAELFNDSLNYISLQKKYIYIIILVFFASSIFGYFNSDQLGFLDKSLKEILNKTEGLDALELIWFIFSNNVTSAISSLFFGALFGILPFFNAIFNGSILGYVYSKAVPVAGFGIIWRLLPHGIFELPAIFISLGLGVHLGASFFGRKKIATFKQRFNRSLRAFLSVVVPLLMLAAIIEGFLIFFIS
ncbi:MAG: stage II sporulation protein M [Nanoarchaeota archaeon]